jgi:hypothetical protein
MNKVERGATLVEGAIVIPIWILFFVAMTDMYFMVSAYMNLTSFSREALYLGAIMNNKFIVDKKMPSGREYCYMSGTEEFQQNAPSANQIDPDCTDSEYRNISGVNSAATQCYVPADSLTGEPNGGLNCGHWLLQDKIYLLAASDKLLTNPVRIGSLTSLYAVTRRGSVSATVLSTPLPSSSTTITTTQKIPTLFVSVRGTFRGMFPIFNGISIRTRVSGPHSSMLLPTSEAGWIAK